jgi:hypothetical protein
MALLRGNNVDTKFGMIVIAIVCMKKIRNNLHFLMTSLLPNVFTLVSFRPNITITITPNSNSNINLQTTT